MAEASNQDFAPFVEPLLSYSQARSWRSVCDQLTRDIYTSAGVETVVSEALPAEQIDALKALLEKRGVKWEDAGKVADVLREAIEVVDTLPVVVMRVAVDLPEATLEKINAWFITEYGYKVLIRVLVDERLIGGVIIEYEGVRGDYSALHEIEETPLKYFLHVDES